MTKSANYLGYSGKDKVTGLEGIITGYAEYLYGCTQLCIVPGSKDNKVSEGCWFDIGRVKVGPLVIEPKEVQVEDDPGPETCAPSTSCH